MAVEQVTSKADQLGAIGQHCEIARAVLWRGMWAAICSVAVMPDGAAAAPPSSADDKRQSVEEIIVAAEHRQRALHDVPLSVAVMTREQADQVQLANFEDMSRYVPNLKIQTNGMFNYIHIRGFGSSYNEGFEQSVGFFVDDIFYSRPHYLLMGFLDIDRVEILRGPQGTLFGKNTVAGAVSVHSAMPEQGWYFGGTGTVGSNNLKTVEAIANIPLWQDKAALRLAAYYTDRDGFMHNTTLNVDDGAFDTLSLRGKARVKITDDLQLTLTYQRNEIEVFHGIRNQLSANSFAPFLDLMQQFDPETEASLDKLTTALDLAPYGLQTSDDYVGRLDYQWHAYDLSLILGSSGFDRFGETDFDGTPIPMIGVTDDQTHRQTSAEIRLVSPPGAWEFVGGLFYLNTRLRDSTDLSAAYSADLAQTLFGLTLPAALLRVPTDFVGEGVLTSLRNLAPAVPVLLERRTSDFHQNSQSLALYGQLGWYVTQHIQIDGGLRVGWDQKKVRYDQSLGTGLQFPGPTLLLGPVAGMEDFSYTDTRDEFSLAPKLSVTWRVTPWASVYATAGRGQKTGGYNAVALRPEGVEFEDERADTIEAGIKSRFFNGQLNANLNVFRTDFKNLQIAVFNGFDIVVSNAPRAVAQGAELEVMMTTNWGLSLFGGAGLLQSSYRDFKDGQCISNNPIPSFGGQNGFCNQSGNRLANAPKVQGALSANQAIALGNWPIDLIVGGDVMYQDDMDLQVDLDPLDRQPAYWMFNVRAGVTTRDGAVSLTIMGRNLTNEIVRVDSMDAPLFGGTHIATTGQPRTWQAQLKVSM